MKLITEGNSLRFVMEEGTFISAVVRKEATKMRTPTKNELVLENATLKEQVASLTSENQAAATLIYDLGVVIETLRSTTKPSAGTRVPKEERLADLPMYTPLQRMQCATHGSVVANKHGYCYHCYNIALGKPADGANARAQVAAHCG